MTRVAHLSASDFLVPIALGNVAHIHSRAGFSATGT